MQHIAFADLPRLSQFTSLATLFIGWIMVEELVIDRHGYDRFLPFYRVGNLCPYDFAVALGLAMTWMILRRSPKQAALQ